MVISGLVPFISIVVLNISIYLQIVQIQKRNAVSSVRSNQQEIRLSQISVAITAGLLLRIFEWYKGFIHVWSLVSLCFTNIKILVRFLKMKKCTTVSYPVRIRSQ